MTTNNFKLCVLLIFLIQALQGASNLTSLGVDAGKIFNQNTEKDIYGPKIKKLFSGFSDEEILESLISALLLIDGNFDGTPHSMPKGIESPYVSIIKWVPDLIENDSYLREALKNETDPRDFYLKSQLALAFSVHSKNEYSAEMKHMLFEDGRFCELSSDNSGFYADISNFAYAAIVDSLSRNGVLYPGRRKNLKISVSKEEILELNNWLNEEFLPRRERRKERISSTPRHKSSLITSTEETVKEESSRVSKWVYIALLIFLLAVSFHLLKNKAVKG